MKPGGELHFNGDKEIRFLHFFMPEDFVNWTGFIFIIMQYYVLLCSIMF